LSTNQEPNMSIRHAATSAQHSPGLSPHLSSHFSPSVSAKHLVHHPLPPARSALRSAGLALGPLALALIGLWGLPAQAQFSSTGAVNIYPGNALVPSGAGNADLGNVGLFVGNGALGSFSALGGSILRVGALSIGNSASGNGNGAVVIDGAGTLVSLVGDGFSNGVVNRLGVGEWGNGSLTVSGGATLNGRAESASCLGQFHYCSNFIGNAAGSAGLMTITGAGSSASFLRFFGVGGLAVFHPPVDSFTFGTPAASTSGTVRVLAGGTLTTDGGNLGLAPAGGSPTGRERSFAAMTIDGANSLWRVTGGTLDNSAASVSTANDRNAWATLNVSNGGKLWIDGRAGVHNYINLTDNGGRTDAVVTGAGSQLLFTGDAGVLQVGSRLGTASLTVLDGGTASGLFYLSVGRDGSVADLLVDGAGSKILINGTASAAANGSAINPAFDIGRNGTGQVMVSHGGRIELVASEAHVNGPQLSLGRDAASSGALTIAGAGSVVSLSAASVVAGGGPTEAFNPFVRVGRDGNGTLNITGGGKLLMEGQALSTVADSRGTNLYVGGTGDNSVGGKGIALVTGAGSEIRLTGSDTFIAVGMGPQSFGQLTLADGASISANGMNVGRSGGVGVLAVDHSQVNFSGQQTGALLSGAFLSIGRSGGTGIANIGNGSVVTMSNMGSSGASLSLGGTGPGPLGDGTLTLSGGSQIHLQAAPGLATLSVARDGSALMRVKGASTVDLGDGSAYIGRLKGSDGTLIISEASSLTAGWVGVGRNKTSTGDEDGGTGTLVLINSTLTATNIVIGSNGFLGGTGTITGNVVNHGIFAPGNSPGTVEIAGSFMAAAGSRMILEVQGDGHGGFATDHVIFGAGQALDLAHLSVEYRFLGNTNPNDFQAQHLFGVDTFFQTRSAGGGTVNLAAQAFSGTSFSAQADGYTITNFSFSATGGAMFTATPVPEPGARAMLLLGLVGLAGLTRLGGTAARRGKVG
jgi:hypothetical protein